MVNVLIITNLFSCSIHKHHLIQLQPATLNISLSLSLQNFSKIRFISCSFCQFAFPSSSAFFFPSSAHTSREKSKSTKLFSLFPLKNPKFLWIQSTPPPHCFSLGFPFSAFGLSYCEHQEIEAEENQVCLFPLVKSSQLNSKEFLFPFSWKCLWLLFPRKPHAFRSYWRYLGFYLGNNNTVLALVLPPFLLTNNYRNLERFSWILKRWVFFRFLRLWL